MQRLPPPSTIWMVAALLTGAGLAGACDQGEGGVTGMSLFAADCDGVGQDRTFEPFVLTVEKFGFNEDRGVVTLRLSGAFRTLDQSDALTIVLGDAPDLREEIAATGSVTRTIVDPGAVNVVLPDPSSPVRAGLSLLERCDQMPASLVASSGAITLTRLGRQQGDKVVGDMNFEVLDRRSGEVVGRGFTADFDFEVRSGSPYSTFVHDDDYWPYK